MQFVDNPWIYLSEVVLHSPSSSSSTIAATRDHASNNEDHELDLKITSVAVCEEHNIIAISTNNGSITTYLKNENIHGRTNSTDFTIKYLLSNDNNDDNDTDGEKPYFTQLRWQGGNSTNLVGGKSNGQIIYIDVLPTKDVDTDQSDELFPLDSNNDIHQSEILDLKWSQSNDEWDGRPAESKRLVSVDKSGCCCLWKTELNVALIPVTKYHNDNGISVISFVDSLFPENEQHNNFLFALFNGSLYHANELGRCNQIPINEEYGRVEVIKEYKQSIVLITRSFQLIQMKVVDEVIVPTKNAKINIELDFDNDILLAPHGQLICLTTKGTVHCFDLEGNINYEIKQPIKGDCQDDEDSTNKPISIAISSTGNILSVLLTNGNCVFWKMEESTGKWILSRNETLVKTNIIDTQNKLTSFAFGQDAFCVSNERVLTIIAQEYARSSCSHDIVALQTGPTTIAMFNENDVGPFSTLDTGIKISGLAIEGLILCVWSSEEIHLYKCDISGNFHLHSEMSTEVQCVGISEESLFLAKDDFLVITDLFGVQKLKISLPKKDGAIHHMQCSNNVLSIFTQLGVVKTFNVSRTEPKLLSANNLVDFHKKVVSMRSNSDGTIISLVSQIHGAHIIHFYFTKSGRVEVASATLKGDYLVMSHWWDSAFGQLFCCELRSTKGNQIRVATLFVSEGNVCIHQEVSINEWSQCIGISVPMNLFISRLSMTSDSILQRKVINGFDDIDPTNVESLSVLVDFFFHLNTGNLDTAYFAIQSNHDNQQAWQKLAQVSVISNRIDIAKRCLVKMGNGMGISSVQKVGEDIALAEVAIQLGLYEEAATIYKSANKVEDLFELYRRQGRYSEALQLNEGLCINTIKLYKQLENFQVYDQRVVLGSNFNGAIRKSLTTKKMALSKMIQANQSVEVYLKDENDIDLYKWYAQYLENKGMFGEAKRIYTAVDDVLSLVRISCLQGDLDFAFKLVHDDNSPSGAYYLARHLEACGDINGAIDCFARSGMYHYAIHLSKSCGNYNELVGLASKCGIPKAIECARYLEKEGYPQMAAEIYLNIGSYENAIQIISKLPLDETTARLKAEVLSIAETLKLGKSDEAVKDCATIMLKSGKHKEAIQLLQKSNEDILSIIEFCARINVIVTEEIIDEIVSNSKNKVDKLHFIKIAAICEEQGNQILACKMYTHGGDRASAIKCLLHSADTRKILAYAFTSRSKEVYIMVANHLQKLDYYDSEEIKRALLQLYTKAKSNEHLARLMISWSSFEAADGEYEIACKWLKEAQKYSTNKEGERTISDDEFRWVETNIKTLQLFETAKKKAFNDKSKAQELCKQIMSNHRREDLIQIGDCFALLVQLQVRAIDASKLIVEMQNQGLTPSEYIESGIIEQIQNSAHIKG